MQQELAQRSHESQTLKSELSVLIVDDHPLFSDAMAQALHSSLDACEIRTAPALAQTFEVLDGGFVPDLVMFDLKLPDVKGISGFEKLRERVPAAKILVISSLASYELVQSLLQKGAMGFLPKHASIATMKFAVNEVVSGRSYVPNEYRQVDPKTDAEFCAYQANPELSALTPQQIKVLKLICVGKQNKQIAYELSLAEATVKAHITALLRRLGVKNRTQAVLAVEEALSRGGGSDPEAHAFLSH